MRSKRNPSRFAPGRRGSARRICAWLLCTAFLPVGAASAESAVLGSPTSEGGLAAYRALSSQIPSALSLPFPLRPGLPVPLVIALHGYGSRGEEAAALWKDAAQLLGAAVTGPDALHGTPAGIGYDWHRVEEGRIRIETTMLGAVSAAGISGARIDSTRIVLAGAYQGAEVALAVALSETLPVRGVVAVAPAWDSRFLAWVSAAPDSVRRRPSIALLVGAEDPLLAGVREAERILLAAGYRVWLRESPGVVHAYTKVQQPDLDAALRFALE